MNKNKENNGKGTRKLMKNGKLVGDEHDSDDEDEDEDEDSEKTVEMRSSKKKE